MSLPRLSSTDPDHTCLIDPLAVACPTCTVDAGQTCKTSAAHPARSRLARWTMEETLDARACLEERSPWP